MAIQRLKEEIASEVKLQEKLLLHYREKYDFAEKNKCQDTKKYCHAYLIAGQEHIETLKKLLAMCDL